DDLQHRTDDLAPARGAERKATAVAGFADDRTEIAEAALARPERVGFARLRVEPHDAIVEEEAGRGRYHARAEDRQQRLRHRAHVAVAVDDREVRGTRGRVRRFGEAGGVTQAITHAGKARVEGLVEGARISDVACRARRAARGHELGCKNA